MPPLWAMAAEYLKQLCPSIRKISLTFRVQLESRNANDADELHFGDGIEALEPVFARDALSGVEDVQFDLYIYHEYRGVEVPKDPITLEQMEDAIRVKLPKLHKRGIVRLLLNCN